MKIRPLQARDNKQIAVIIRQVLEEFKANKPGTVYNDPTTDDLYTLFSTPGSAYFVLENAQNLLGGAGIYPTRDLPNGYAELVKLYLVPSARGAGWGKKLMEQCFLQAQTLGYTHLYLETMEELNLSLPLYKKMGFAYLPGPLGNSGHTDCPIQMLKKL